ncbi:hypothetical protein BGX28_000681 [Mortierella sp. GBA30]|nr:hypothetical protein BGX28_000681 [Mortierella sp. GBA30]
MKENKASITIQATPREVWQVLTDLEHYHDWNPMLVQANGTIAVGQSLDLKMRLPAKIFCGAPLSCSWSPKITKVEPNCCLEWTGIKGFMDRTHYFQLNSSDDGKVTEFTQGEHYSGWGASLFSSFGSMDDTRRGFVAMNNALQMEAARRKSIAEKTGLNEKEGKEKEVEVAQLDISDLAAVAAAGVMAQAATTPTTASDNGRANDEGIPERNTTTSVGHAEECIPNIATPEPSVAVEDAPAANANASPTTEHPTEISEKRSSIIGVVSALFSSSKPSSTPERLPTSPSKDELISKAVSDEEEEEEEEEDDGDEANEEKYYMDPVEDTVAKNEREAKNAERIELDLGSSAIDFGDFGL